MNIHLTWLTPDFAVAPQIQPEQMAELAAEGFRSVVNHRMPGEPGQPPQDALERSAAAEGLEYAWQPVHSGAITVQDVARFAELIERLPRPLLAFCRSGGRSSILVQAALSGAHRRTGT